MSTDIPTEFSFDLDGRIALVTGASRGIGKAIAERLAASGAHVIISSRKQDDCQTVVEEIEAAGGSAEAMACNIGDLEMMQGLFDGIGEKHGRLDILVNNAATNPYYGPILDTPVEAFDKTLDVNMRGYFYASQMGARLMLKNGKGAIVNVASINALKTTENQGIYAISKAAVAHMTRAFAQELGRKGVRVNAILPGLTKTAFAGALFDNEKFYKMAISAIPQRRHAIPEEMAGTVHYLVSDAASYTNGECLVVDGGMTI